MSVWDYASFHRKMHGLMTGFAANPYSIRALLGDGCMEERKEKQEISDPNQIKKNFIREQIKPQRRKNIIRLLHRGILVLCAAVLFGGISALSFMVMRIYFPWQDLDENVSAVPVRPTASQSLEVETISDGVDQATLSRLEDFDIISGHLAKVGERANEAVVGLKRSDMTLSGVFSARDTVDAMPYCGILFHESTKSYFILTEYAMAEAADSLDVAVKFFHGKTVTAKVSGSNERLDLAVIRVDKSQLTEQEQEDIVIAELGEYSTLSLGRIALAVGKPNGQLYSVSSGLMTSQVIPVPVLDHEIQLYTMNLSYQKDRKGFVLNTKGQLVGMLSAQHTKETGEIDTAFFSLSDLTEDLNRMIQGVSIPHLGIYGVHVPQEDVRTLGKGIYIQGIEPKSPAYEGKLRVADVITEMDGQAVQTMDELHRYLAGCQSGQEVAVTVYRLDNSQNKKKKLKITIR